MEFESTAAVDAVIASQARTPHAILQCREEWEVHSVVMHDVPDNDMRADADALPYMPVTSSIELPVEATTFGKEPLITGATRRMAPTLRIIRPMEHAHLEYNGLKAG